MPQVGRRIVPAETQPRARQKPPEPAVEPTASMFLMSFHSSFSMAYRYSYFPRVIPLILARSPATSVYVTSVDVLGPGRPIFIMNFFFLLAVITALLLLN